jgi:hypothetical protein
MKMTSQNIKAQVIHSRSQLLNKALIHLRRYYSELSKESPHDLRYVPTRKGDVLEGLITVNYGQQYLVASVTTCDVDFATNRKAWIGDKVEAPQLEQNTLILEAFFFGVLASAALYPYMQEAIFGALLMGSVVSILYLLARIHTADEYGKRLKKKPSNMLKAFLPHFNIPTNEDWLVVGEELFEAHLNITITTLQSLCQQEGIGLLVLQQNEELKKYADPRFKNMHVKDKYDNPNMMSQNGLPKSLEDVKKKETDDLKKFHEARRKENIN